MTRLFAFATGVTAAFILVLGLVFGTAAAAADERKIVGTADYPAHSMTLFDTPCSRGLVLASVNPQYRSRMKDAEVYWKEEKRTAKACWLKTNEEEAARHGPAYVIVDEDANYGVMPEEQVTLK